MAAVLRADEPSRFHESVGTLAEELNRKAFEQLERLVRHRDQGKITPQQFSTGVDTLFHTTSGLVGRDLFELISKVKDEPSPDWIERTVFMHLHTARFVSIQRGIDGVRVTMTKWRAEPRGWEGRVRDTFFKDEVIPSKAAREFYENLRRKLEGEDYVELT